MRRPLLFSTSSAKIGLLQQPRPNRVVDVVIDVSNDVRDPGDSLRWCWRDAPDLFRRHAVCPWNDGRSVADFPRQLRPWLCAEHVDDPQALLVVVEAAGNQIVDNTLPRVPERRARDRGQARWPRSAPRSAAGPSRCCAQFATPRVREPSGSDRRSARRRPASCASGGGRPCSESRSRSRLPDESDPPARAAAVLRVAALGGLGREDVALTLFQLFSYRRSIRAVEIPRGSSFRAPAVPRRTTPRASGRDPQRCCDRPRRPQAESAPQTNTGTCSRE